MPTVYVYVYQGLNPFMLSHRLLQFQECRLMMIRINGSVLPSANHVFMNPCGVYKGIFDLI